MILKLYRKFRALSMKKEIAIVVITIIVVAMISNLIYSNFIDPYRVLTETGYINQMATMEDEIIAYKYQVEALEQAKQILESDIESFSEMNTALNQIILKNHNTIADAIYTADELGEFKMTAYNLGYPSIGRYPDDPIFGLTASGFSLKGLNWDVARTVAVDRSKIPLGTELYIRFHDESMQKYDGIYVARDTGGAIKGNRIDVYLGTGDGEVGGDADQRCTEFGVRYADVYVIQKLMEKETDE